MARKLKEESVMNDSSGQKQPQPGEQPDSNVKMVACDNCGRKFAEDRVDTHFNICVNQRERKIYNIAEKRVQGTEAEELLKSGEVTQSLGLC